MDVMVSSKCNVCGSDDFRTDRWKRPIVCNACGSRPRHRICLLAIDHVVKPTKGMKVLHFAPEVGLYKAMLDRVGTENYDVRDYDSETFTKKVGIEVKSFDLCTDTFNLPQNHYDLIIHNHVIEHVMCNYTAVLHGLQAAIKPGGYQVFSAPVMEGHFRDDIHPGRTPEYREKQFKQNDHARLFGDKDIFQTLGLAIGLRGHYALKDHVPEGALVEANIPEKYWTGISGATALIWQK